MLKKMLICAIGLLFSCSTFNYSKTYDGRTIYSSQPDVSQQTVLTGTVMDSKTKKPIKNASVEIKNANMGVGYYLAKTDSSGVFKIKNFIPYIMYNTEVSAAGYVTYKAPSVIGASAQKIFLDMEATVSGTVTDSSGKPLSNVDVRLEADMYEEAYKPSAAVTGSDGTYVFDKLPQGRYKISFSSAGYISETLYIQSLKAGESFKLPLTMYRPAFVSGNITVADIGAPAYNVDVVARGRSSHSAATYQDGSFRIEDVKPGSYELNVQHQGFAVPAKKVISISEGENKTGIDYSLTIKEPEAQIYSYRYTFAPGNALTFSLRTFRLETVTVTVYQVPLTAFMRTGGQAFASTAGFKQKLRWQESIEDFDPYQWRYQELSVKDSLPTGGYCIEVAGTGGVVSRKFFSVTSVGAVAKRSSGKVFAYVTDLLTNKPVKNAQVILYENTPIKSDDGEQTFYNAPEAVEDLPLKVIAKGKTGDDGVYQTNISSEHYITLLAIGSDGSYAICNTGSSSEFKSEKDRFMIYTDRPVYRSGDTVFYKIIGKERQSMFLPQKGKKIYHRVLNVSNGRILKEGWLSMDEWGTAASEVIADPGAGLGSFAVSVGPDSSNMYADGKFYVEQYRKPEYNVELAPSQDTFINGDQIEFRVEGKYFFGAPVRGGLVRYRFYENKISDSDSYWWEEEGGRGSYNRLKLEGSKYLDDNGLTSLKLSAGNVPYDRIITLEAAVTDSSNVSITESRAVRVGRGEFYIKLKPSAEFFKTGDKKPLAINTVRQNGEPVRADVKLKVYRYIWKPYQRVYVHDSRPVFSEKITTDVNGEAVVTLPGNFASAGEYDVVAESKDRKNNLITASNVIWVYNPDGSGQVSSRFKNLELQVEQRTFSGSGQLTCLLKSRYTDGYVWLTVEGRDVYQSKVVKLTGNITPVSINVDSSYAPNFYISAAMQIKRALYMATENISIPVKGVDLILSVKTDKEKYRPGEEALVTLTASDEKGSPVAADISLAAVDEALFSVRKDSVPKMKDFFYGRISNWVLTGYSYPISLLAGASKDAPADVRQDFKDTAFWKANIRTDSSGKASVSFKLPDNLTKWRLTARGHDKSGKVGERRESFSVSKNIVTRIAKPRFFVEGDEVSVLGMVTNNSDKGMTSIRTDMFVDGSSVAGAETISLPAFASDRKAYRLMVPDRERLTLRFDADSGSDGKDSVQIPVRIEEQGSFFRLYGAGNAGADSSLVLEPIRSDKDFEFVPNSIEISVTPSPVMKMLQASEFLVKYPYGCVEQTLSGFMPSYALHDFLKKQNMLYLVSEEFIKKINDKAYNGIKRIENAQNYDGTWGWWAGGEGNAYLTGCVLESFYKAKSAGLAVNEAVIKKGVAAALEMTQEQTSNVSDIKAKAYLFYGAALHGSFSMEAFEKLSNTEDAYVAANVLKAIYASKPVFDGDAAKNAKIIKENSDRLTLIIKNSLKRDETGAYWTEEGEWGCSKTELTASVLEALLVSGDESAIPAQAAASIAKAEEISTRESAALIYSLISYMEHKGANVGEALDLRFYVDGRDIGSVKYKPEDKPLASDLRIMSPLKSFGTVKKLTVEAKGTAGQAASFEAVVSGTLKYKPSVISSFFGSEERSLAALSNGIRLNRTYASLTRVQDAQHREYLVPNSFEGAKSINQGDELIVRIRFAAQDDLQYLVLEDYLPSGFEVVNENAYGSSLFVRAEHWDNRMVYFFDGLKKGVTYEIAYIIRAELAGKFLSRAARMECMYEPSIQGWSAPAIIEVKED